MYQTVFKFGSIDPIQVLRSRARGVLLSIVVAVAAQFVSDHYGTPAMLMALLLGIALQFLSAEETCRVGIDFTARAVLRFGVALLGARISLELLAGLGLGLIAMLVAGVLLTIGFGLLAARFLGRGWRFGLLTGGAVAICGASAAMAISAVLPRNEHAEQNLIFTVLSVTMLSTAAMILYPILGDTFAFDDVTIGVFLGGTIHDVAQVVGAGFSVSEEAGEVATLVKLFRVAMLAPIVLVISLLMRGTFGASNENNHPPVLPLFVIGFLGFATLNSLGFIPAPFVGVLSEASRWALLIAIAAVGMKTSLKRILEVGRVAITLVVAETVFIAGFMLLGISLLHS